MADVDTQKASKISARDWHVIRERWIEHADFAEPGLSPEFLLCELPSLEQKLAMMKQRGQTEPITDEMPGLRQGVLHEGIYLFHKATHIFGACLVHIGDGMCTWSLSSAYQSAYFAMTSILCMLGVVVVNTENDGIYLVDVWHTAEKKNKGKRREPIIFIYRSGKIEHGQLWACFQRALEKTENSVLFCHRTFRDEILTVEPELFARQRNFLHYRTNVWTFNDLHSCVVRPEFARVTQAVLDPEDDGFLPSLAFGLIRTGRQMIGDLAKSSGPVRNELALIDNWLDQPFNQIYRENEIAIAGAG